jgi:hypothetical protein
MRVTDQTRLLVRLTLAGSVKERCLVSTVVDPFDWIGKRSTVPRRSIVQQIANAQGLAAGSVDYVPVRQNPPFDALANDGVRRLDR